MYLNAPATTVSYSSRFDATHPYNKKFENLARFVAHKVKIGHTYMCRYNTMANRFGHGHNFEHQMSWTIDPSLAPAGVGVEDKAIRRTKNACSNKVHHPLRTGTNIVRFSTQDENKKQENTRVKMDMS